MDDVGEEVKTDEVPAVNKQINTQMMIVLMKETERAVRVCVTAGDSSKWSCLRP